jgi:ABC-type multidrug transport system ATPase subunit
MLSSTSLLAVEGLTKRYGQRRAVEGISIALSPRTVHGFVGANGAGKTTALRMLAGILPPEAGRGHVLGFDIRNQYPEIRKYVGYAAQRLSLYGDLSVLDNLLFRARLYDLAKTAVESVVHDFGLEAHLAQRARTLSGGWARRLQVAAAVIHRPRLILLDEPTAGLDATASRDLWHRLRRLAASGSAVIVNTHDLVEAERCDTISLFHQGRIAVHGLPGEVVRGAPAEAYLVRGPAASLLDGPLGSLGEVLDMRREGVALRVVVGRKGLARLQSLAAMYAATVAPTEMRLADAVFAYERLLPVPTP